jgi:tetratricopeptide (TPR) repeat protein
MRDEEIKKKLIEWLNQPFNEPDSEWSEALINCETLDETLLGAYNFLFDTQNDFRLLHQTIGELDIPLQTKNNSVRNYSMAAVIILIISISIFALLTNNAKNKFEIIEEGLPVFMATNPNNSDLFMNAYRTGDYNKAIEIGHNLPFTDTSNFYVGCSYLYNHDTKNAIHYLSKISEESEFYCNALYQKAFANANRKDYEEAITLLKELLNKDCSNYNKKAEKFLKELTP